MNKNEYIERELKKWRERYEISFEREFDLKLMIELQYQIIATPKEHIKSVSELVHTKNKIMQNLGLKPIYKKPIGQTWIIELDYQDIEKRIYNLRVIKVDDKTGKLKYIRVKNKEKYRTFNEISYLLLKIINEETPSRLLIDKVGVDGGLYNSLLERLNDNDWITLDEDGYLSYKSSKI